MVATIIGRQDGGIKVYRKHIARNCTKCSKKNELKPWKVKGWVIPPETEQRVCSEYGTGIGCV